MTLPIPEDRTFREMLDVARDRRESTAPELDGRHVPDRVKDEIVETDLLAGYEPTRQATLDDFR